MKKTTTIPNQNDARPVARKLRLSRETLRVLDGKDLKRVVGGLNDDEEGSGVSRTEAHPVC